MHWAKTLSGRFERAYTVERTDVLTGYEGVPQGFKISVARLEPGTRSTIRSRGVTFSESRGWGGSSASKLNRAFSTS